MDWIRVVVAIPIMPLLVAMWLVAKVLWVLKYWAALIVAAAYTLAGKRAPTWAEWI
jgi:hypothetical protein